jgi:hypothetical protein
MGRPKGCFHAEPDRFHGEKFAGERGHRKTGLPRKIVLKNFKHPVIRMGRSHDEKRKTGMGYVRVKPVQIN